MLAYFPTSLLPYFLTYAGQPWYVLVPSARPSTLQVVHRILAREVGRTHIDDSGRQVDSSGRVVKGPGKPLLFNLEYRNRKDNTKAADPQSFSKAVRGAIQEQLWFHQEQAHSERERREEKEAARVAAMAAAAAEVEGGLLHARGIEKMDIDFGYWFPTPTWLSDAFADIDFIPDGFEFISPNAFVSDMQKKMLGTGSACDRASW